MNKELDKYLKDIPDDAYYTSNYGRRLAQSVHGRSTVRYNFSHNVKRLVDMFSITLRVI